VSLAHCRLPTQRRLSCGRFELGKTKLLIVAVSLIVATLSYYLVEWPFRSGKLRPARGPLMRLAAAAAIVSVALGLTASAAGGFSSRFSKQELDTYAPFTPD
jgi:peptidoglycan/LPS O-acetylase OafA/YrhL